MELQDLRKYKGEKMQIGNKVFVFDMWTELHADLCVWIEEGKQAGEGDMFYATINYDGERGVPIQYESYELGAGEDIDNEFFAGEVKDFEDYKSICKFLVERIWRNKVKQ